MGHSLPTHVQGWQGISVSNKGEYLGFVVGPGKQQFSWDKPLRKYQDRVKRWAALGAGMQYGALTYNVFALSTLLYVGQLEPIPEDVFRAERLNVVRMFPGPGNWLAPKDAWALQESFGLAKSAHALSIVASAAKLRVAYFGCQLFFGLSFAKFGALRRSSGQPP